MTTSANKEELRRARDHAAAALREIEDRERDERNARLVGKCLRYRNSYGDGESWWMYCRVLRVEDGNVITHEFQTTCRDEIEIKPSRRHFFGMSDGWRLIEEAEFDDEWRALQARVAALP